MSIVSPAPRFQSAFRRLLLALLLPLSGCAASDEGASSTAIAFEGARVIVGDGTAIASATIVVDGGRITSVGAAGDVDVPEGAARMDLSGKTIIPALINTHMHLGTTRADLVGQLEHLAYYGVGAAVSLGSDAGDETLALRSYQVGARRHIFRLVFLRVQRAFRR